MSNAHRNLLALRPPAVLATVATHMAACLSSTGTASAAEPPPVGAFTDAPAVSLVSISPTGKYLAIAMRQGEERAFQVVTHPEREVKVNFLLGEDRQVANAAWISDDLLLATPARRMWWTGGEQRASTGELVTINAATGRSRTIGSGRPLHLLPAMPNHILVAASESPRFGEVHRYDLRLPHSRQIKQLRQVARSPTPQNAGGGFVVDADGRVAFAIGNTEDYRTVVHYRSDDGEDWQLLESHRTRGQGWEPVHFGPRPGTYYTLDSRDAPTRGLGLYDVADGSHEVLVRHRQADVGPLQCDYDCQRVYGVLVQHHYPRVVYVDPVHPLAKAHAMLARTYPEDLVLLTSVTQDAKQAVAFVSGDRRPGDYLLVDVDARKVAPLVATRPNLPAEALSPMTPVELKARDGRTVYGFVTSPPSAPKPGPLAVLVHGGPHGISDSWGFNGEVQLLASRGYHVLQVNYRGSGGYGVEYERAGYGEWGRKIEDDVADGVRWAVQSGIADAGRVCVLGFSYGGYSALMGAARDPELYRCAVGGSGIYDLELLHKTGDMPRLRALLSYLDQALGDDPEVLAARSPTTLASRIAARVLLVHGTEDRRAPPVHAQRMRAALERSGNAPEWMLLKGHGHGFATNRARREVYEHILEFLDANIGRGAVEG